MGTRPRQLLLVLALILAAFAAPVGAGAGGALAGGVCNPGTHWDNRIGACV
jgi:hypothetical protein